MPKKTLKPKETHAIGDCVYDQKAGKWMTWNGKEFVPEKDWNAQRDAPPKPDAPKRRRKK